MTTRFREENLFPAPVADVVEMLWDRGFREQVLAAVDLTTRHVSVRRGDPVCVVTAEVTQPAGAAGRLLGTSTVTVVFEETWTSPQQAFLVTRAVGLPLRVDGRVHVEPRGRRTAVVVEGEVTCHVLGLAGIVERFTRSTVLARIYASQQTVGDTWLASRTT